MSEEKKPRTPGEQWDAVMQAAMGPEARELEEASDEEIDRELRAAGINPDRLAADGNALAARLMREAGIGGGDRETEKENDREHDHEHEHEHEHERDHDHDHDHDHDREGGNAPVAAVLADANVLPFAPVAARKRPRWPLLLVAAALGAGVTKVAVTVAERDLQSRRPSVPRSPSEARSPSGFARTRRESSPRATTRRASTSSIAPGSWTPQATTPRRPAASARRRQRH